MAASTTGSWPPYDLTVDILTLVAAFLPILAYPCLPSRVPTSPFSKTQRPTRATVYTLFFTSTFGIVVYYLIRENLISFFFHDYSLIVKPRKVVNFLVFGSLAISLPPLTDWGRWDITATARLGSVPPKLLVPASLLYGATWLEVSARFVAPWMGVWWDCWLMDGWIAIGLAIVTGKHAARRATQILERYLGWIPWSGTQENKAGSGSVLFEDEPWWTWVMYRVVMIATPTIWLVALLRFCILASG